MVLLLMQVACAVVSLIALYIGIAGVVAGWRHEAKPDSDVVLKVCWTGDPVRTPVGTRTAAGYQYPHSGAVGAAGSSIDNDAVVYSQFLQ